MIEFTEQFITMGIFVQAVIVTVLIGVFISELHAKGKRETTLTFLIMSIGILLSSLIYLYSFLAEETNFLIYASESVILLIVLILFVNIVRKYWQYTDLRIFIPLVVLVISVILTNFVFYLYPTDVINLINSALISTGMIFAYLFGVAFLIHQYNKEVVIYEKSN